MTDLPCYARRQSDEMVCNVCRLRWDVQDTDKPECRQTPPKMHTRKPVPLYVPFASGLPD